MIAAIAWVCSKRAKATPSCRAVLSRVLISISLASRVVRSVSSVLAKSRSRAPQLKAMIHMSKRHLSSRIAVRTHQSARSRKSKVAAWLRHRLKCRTRCSTWSVEETIRVYHASTLLMFALSRASSGRVTQLRLSMEAYSTIIRRSHSLTRYLHRRIWALRSPMSPLRRMLWRMRGRIYRARIWLRHRIRLIRLAKLLVKIRRA